MFEASDGPERRGLISAQPGHHSLMIGSAAPDGLGFFALSKIRALMSPPATGRMALRSLFRPPRHARGWRDIYSATTFVERRFRRAALLVSDRNEMPADIDYDGHATRAPAGPRARGALP